MKMVIVRNRLSSLKAGGPRQLTELRDRVIVSANTFEAQSRVVSDLSNLGLTSVQLDTAPVIVAEPQNRIEEVLEKIEQRSDSVAEFAESVETISKARDEDETILDTTAPILTATQEMLNIISDISEVIKSNFVTTKADFGPENLRLSPNEMPTIPLSNVDEPQGTLEDVNDSVNIREAWEETRGSGVTIAVFDTGYAEDLLSSSRVVDTFHAGGTESAFASAEGHGTMTAGAAAANADENAPYNGAAPEADVILVRITDSEGQIRTDIIAQAWDWLIQNHSDRTIVTNHSYGTPICSGRPKASFCDDSLADVIKIANSEANITSVYAAGNESSTCGRRPSGLTNAITGHNSLQEVIAVGALLTSGREVQRYSSHGRGDCSPISDPKPNVVNPIPRFTYYGEDDGWVIKDMSIGLFGSGSGTSHASPYTAGQIALLQSKALSERGTPLQTEELKSIIQKTAEPPHVTQVNLFGFISEKGYDARFGFGQLNINKAMEMI